MAFPRDPTLDRIPDPAPRPPRPWEVFRQARQDDPPNALRYAPTIWPAVAMVLVVAFLTWIVFPTRAVELDMRADVADARARGFPQIPPANASPDAIEEFAAVWGLSCDDMLAGRPVCVQLTELSFRHGAYSNDISILFMGVLAGLIAALFLSALVFSRALNNLYALGRHRRWISPGWAFGVFFIPLVNLVVPWLIVDRLWRNAWASDGSGGAHDGARSLPSLVVALWGIVIIVTAVLNPLVTTWFIGRTDIDAWLLSLEWVSRSLLWTPVPAIFTALLMVIITWRQHRRYTQLEAAVMRGGAEQA